MFLLLACAESETASLEPLAGTVVVESGEEAEVAGLSAFATFAGSNAGVVVSPNPDSTCDDAVSYFSGGGDPDFNGADVGAAGFCNLYVRIDQFENGAAMVDSTDATVSLNCAAGEGEWVYEERNKGYKGWYFSGPFWVGSPTGYTLTLSGQEGGDLTLELEMSEYSGRFPYDEDNPEADPASGAVSGGVVAEWCEDLSQGLF
jgi:hypothetical protein